MLSPSISELMQHIPSRYLLVNVTARRAREIAETAERQEIRLSEKPVKLAISEIANGALVGQVKKEYNYRLD
ncbi:MAG: DNA-directed RNA polymerase subunit omega [Oscillospiraceae bacterium]|jgi:DNA-directed RNA polymerase subunit omega|nr:DNA-directed RNA polymerase subunit omega [Oscillospiraceae bacterium]